LTPVAIATIQTLQILHYSQRKFQSGITRSVPVKDNCALFAPAPYFRARAIRWCHLNFSSADSCCHGNEFWDKIDYNSAPVKDNCSLFAPTPDFQARAIRWCHLGLNFFPADPVAMATNFVGQN